MLGFAETFGGTIASFIIPAAAGLAIISIAARFIKAKYLAAFAIGLYFWFFSDTIGDANLLGANEGFSGGVFHVALWACFGVGLILMLTLDREMFSPGPEGMGFGFAIPVLVAIAVGIHGFGEGRGAERHGSHNPEHQPCRRVRGRDRWGGVRPAQGARAHDGRSGLLDLRQGPRQGPRR